MGSRPNVQGTSSAPIDLFGNVPKRTRSVSHLPVDLKLSAFGVCGSFPINSTC